MVFTRSFFFPLLIILLAIVACKHPPTNDVGPKNISTNNVIDTGNCDTLNVTYSITIKKVLEGNCSRCHGSSVYTTQGSGYNFDDYLVISTQANSGNLAKAINHSPGAVPMPVDLPSKISDCSIRKFMIWISAGAPNN